MTQLRRAAEDTDITALPEKSTWQTKHSTRQCAAGPVLRRAVRYLARMDR
jgi:hypothetical protein